MVANSTSLSVVLLSHQALAIFAVGGGGAADGSKAGSSGFFKYAPNVPCAGTVQLEIAIGAGGEASGENGTATTVRLDGVEVVTVGGGGGAGGAGWSGGLTGTGGSNGQYGSGESLPALCGEVVLAPGATGAGDGD